MSRPPPNPQVTRLIFLSMFIALAAVVGTAPASYYLHSRALQYSFVAEAIIVGGASLFAKRSKIPNTYSVDVLELVLRGLAAVSMWGFLGLLILITHQIVFYVSKWVLALIHLVFSTVAINPATIAFYVTFGLAILFGLGIVVGIVRTIATRVYSESLSSRTAAYSETLKGQTRTWLYISGSLLALVAMQALLLLYGGSGSFFTHLMIQLIPYFATAWLLTLGRRVSSDSETVGAIGLLLKSLGFAVVYSPSSEDASVQTLLTGVDMIATKDDKAEIIQIKTSSSSSETLDWTIGSGLRMKARALQLPDVAQKLESIPLVGKKVEPLLVICGRKLDASLEQYAQEESLTVVPIEMAEVDAILALTDQDKIKLVAQKHFPNLAATGVTFSDLQQPAMEVQAE